LYRTTKNTIGGVNEGNLMKGESLEASGIARENKRKKKILGLLTARENFKKVGSLKKFIRVIPM
jgi:hypothetical protein